MLGYEVFEPARSAGLDLDIVYNNHLGASVSGDVAGDAQYLANDTGLRVLAYDRRGTGDGVSMDRNLTKILSNNYLESVSNYGRVLAALAKSEGFGRLLLVGKSAGGCETLAMASSGVIDEMAGVAVMDPLGMVSIGQIEGFRTWIRYQRGPEQEAKAMAEAVPEMPTTKQTLAEKLAMMQRAAALGRRQAVDIAHYRGVWNTTVGIQSALVLAHARTDIPVVMTFASNTFVAESEYIEHAVNELPKERQAANPDGAPFVTGILPGTLHSEFDKPQAVSRQAKNLIQLVLNYQH